MSVQTKRYVRKPLYVDAVQVTATNMEEVAKWANGVIEIDGDGVSHIKISVIRPQRARQSQAFVDDYVLKSNGGYKIYTPKAFRDAFNEVGEVKELSEKSYRNLKEKHREKLIREVEETVQEVLNEQAV